MRKLITICFILVVLLFLNNTCYAKTSQKSKLSVTIKRTINEEQDTIKKCIREKEREEIEKLRYKVKLYLLSHLIYAEAGSDWCSDKMQLYVGSVVLNRVSDEDYPDNIEDVIYDEGQYECIMNGNFYNEPNERAINNARYLIENGSVLPDDVVFQAQFTQGSGIYTQEQNMYFCFK